MLTELKQRKGREEQITKGIYRRARSIFGHSLDQQVIAIGIEHALKRPELSIQQSVNIGIDAIKLMQGCSIGTQLSVRVVYEL